MRAKQLFILILFFVFSVAPQSMCEELALKPEVVSKIFYDQALHASWACRVERVAKSPENERKGQYEALTEVAFRYWVYSRNKVIEPDHRFENQLYSDFILLKNIPIKYLDIPIKGSIFKAIPGFKWSLDEFKIVSVDFKSFILNLKEQN